MTTKQEYQAAIKRAKVIDDFDIKFDKSPQFVTHSSEHFTSYLYETARLLITIKVSHDLMRDKLHRYANIEAKPMLHHLDSKSINDSLNYMLRQTKLLNKNKSAKYASFNAKINNIDQYYKASEIERSAIAIYLIIKECVEYYRETESSDKTLIESYELDQVMKKGSKSVTESI